MVPRLSATFVLVTVLLAGGRIVAGADAAVHHYEYVVPDGSVFVYDMDNGHRLVKHVRVPTTAGVRGISASASSGMLYLSYGGDGGSFGSGSLLEYSLTTDTVVWTRNYSTGIDSMDISPDGRTIYMPTGELAQSRSWRVIDAATGDVRGSFEGGQGPHNTVVSLDGTHLYMGGRNDRFLVAADSANGTNVRRIGPLKNGVRPFTINRAETLAFTTATGFLGFQVSSITTGRVLFTVPIAGYDYDPSTFCCSAPSHGISLSPDEREIWVIDAPNQSVHVFDVAGLPSSPPRQVADIALQGGMSAAETPCAYDCAKDGWLQHSHDGRFVYVGDAGDVIDTRTRKTVTVLPALNNSRKHIEVDFQNGVPVLATPREGLGYGPFAPSPPFSMPSQGSTKAFQSGPAAGTKPALGAAFIVCLSVLGLLGLSRRRRGRRTASLS